MVQANEGVRERAKKQASGNFKPDNVPGSEDSSNEAVRINVKESKKRSGGGNNDNLSAAERRDLIREGEIGVADENQLVSRELTPEEGREFEQLANASEITAEQQRQIESERQQQLLREGVASAVGGGVLVPSGDNNGNSGSSSRNFSPVDDSRVGDSNRTLDQKEKLTVRNVADRAQEKLLDTRDSIRRGTDVIIQETKAAVGFSGAESTGPLLQNPDVQNVGITLGTITAFAAGATVAPAATSVVGLGFIVKEAVDFAFNPNVETGSDLLVELVTDVGAFAVGEGINRNSRTNPRLAVPPRETTISIAGIEPEFRAEKLDVITNTGRANVRQVEGSVEPTAFKVVREGQNFRSDGVLREGSFEETIRTTTPTGRDVQINRKVAEGKDVLTFIDPKSGNVIGRKSSNARAQPSIERILEESRLEEGETTTSAPGRATFEQREAIRREVETVAGRETTNIIFDITQTTRSEAQVISPFIETSRISAVVDFEPKVRFVEGEIIPEIDVAKGSTRLRQADILQQTQSEFNIIGEGTTRRATRAEQAGEALLRGAKIVFEARPRGKRAQTQILPQSNPFEIQIERPQVRRENNVGNLFPASSRAPTQPALLPNPFELTSQENVQNNVLDSLNPDLSLLPEQRSESFVIARQDRELAQQPEIIQQVDVAVEQRANQRLVNRQRSRQRDEIIQDVFNDQRIIQEPISRQINVPLQRTVQEQEVTEITRNRITPRPLIPEIIESYLIAPPKFDLRFDNDRRQNQEEGFFAQVRRRGSFINVSPLALSKEDALANALSVASQTAGVSARIVPAGRDAEATFFGLRPKRSQFRQRKGVFIEKNAFRIDSPGEREEIPFAGLRAQRLF